MATLSTLINTEQQVNPQTNAHSQRALPSIYISDNVRSFPSISFLPFIFFPSPFSPSSLHQVYRGTSQMCTHKPRARCRDKCIPAPQPLPPSWCGQGSFSGEVGGGKFSKNPPTQIPSPVAFAWGETLRALQRGYWGWIQQGCGQHLRSCHVVTCGGGSSPELFSHFRAVPAPSQHTAMVRG